MPVPRSPSALTAAARAARAARAFSPALRARPCSAPVGRPGGQVGGSTQGPAEGPRGRGGGFPPPPAGWQDGITDSMDMSLSELQELVTGSLACCNSWSRKESDTTEQLN